MATPLMPKKITDYTTLKTMIQSYVNRQDPEFVAALEMFIRLGETRIYRELRTPANERLVSHDGVDGVSLSIPHDYLEVREMYRNGLPLTRMTADEYQAAKNGQRQSRRAPRYGFARIEGEFHFLPEIDITKPRGEDVIKFYYYADFGSSYNDDADTNAVLVSQPDLYLASTLIAAFEWTKNESQRNYYMALYDGKMKAIKSHARNSDQSGGQLYIRGGY